MNLKANESYHVCPRNCFSACTMIATVENGKLVNLVGDPEHPYTKGKLCAKGHAYIEKNYHKNRLKFPYFQEVKGSGHFKQITWESAFDLIINKISNIYEQNKSFIPIGLYKYSGNFGVHHFVTDQFFSSIGNTTTIVGSPCSSAGLEGISYDVGALKMSDSDQITNAKVIIIWGGNPAVTNTHLIPFIIEAKAKGAKMVVIDPLYTQTAELADLFIQIRPSADGALANLLLKGLFEANKLDQQFLQDDSFGFDYFAGYIKQIDTKAYAKTCEVPEKAIHLLISWLKEAGAVSHIVGLGLQRHSNGGQNIRAIQALGAARGDIGKKGGGVFYNQGETYVFTNQQFFSSQHLDQNNRIINMNEWIKKGIPSYYHPPLEMMWISCRNPLTQEPQPQLIAQHLKKIPFVVTVEHFMTPTAMMSNLVLPTTTHFEENDIVTNFWHKEVALNEKAIAPYYESRSEWAIMKELAIRLSERYPDICSFPIHSSEEEYLNSQFNEEVEQLYRVKSIADFKKKRFTAYLPDVAWEDRQFATPTGKYQFYSAEAKHNGFPAMPIFVDGRSPTDEHPFWLITPHNPYTLNSQFHFLNLSDENEAFVAIHPKKAKELSIFDGEVVKVFNKQASIEIKAVYSIKVPKDILMIYQGWYPDSDVNVNELVPVLETDMGAKVSGANGIAFYDTFVNIGKL